MDDTSLLIEVAGATVHRLGYGADNIAASEDPAALLRRAVELGVQFIDTADSYADGASERLLGETLSPMPPGVVLATKSGFVMEPEPWTPDGRPERLKRACDESLGRLRLERIDLYQLHAPDPAVPLEDSVGALVELRDEGKIGHIGLSNVDTEQVARALALTPIASVQNRYNLRDRSSEQVLDLCAANDIAFIPWSPTRTGDDDAIAAVARTHEATATQVALAWLLQHSPALLPIPGTSSIAHLEQNVAATKLVLSDDDVRRLEAEPTPIS